MKHKSKDNEEDLWQYEEDKPDELEINSLHKGQRSVQRQIQST